MKTDQLAEPLATIEWKDPPAQQKYDWYEIARKLRRRPMKWALVFKGDRSAKVNAIAAGKVPGVHPELGFEIRTRNNTRVSPRTCDLYLRYNPAKVDPLREQVRLTRERKRR